MGSGFLLAVCCIIGGNVHTSAGAPIAHARVSIVGSHHYATESDVRGRFSVTGARGSYQVSVTSPGFSGARIARLEVIRDTALDIALESLNSAHIRTIARITVDGRLALSQSSIPTVNLTRSDFEAAGYDRIIDALNEVPSVTFARPDGGSATGPSVVALRGPDPSETLVLLDGQLLNDGNTGDLDLSRFPVAAFSGVDVSEGLGPQDRLGSNTIGGAVNVVSLQPVRGQQTRASTSIGSFGSSDSWVNTSGSRGRLGYAVAVDNQQESGYVNQDGLLCDPTQAQPCAAAQTIHLGSTISSRAGLLNLHYAFSQASDLAFRVFALGNVRDESALLNAPLAGTQGFAGPGSAVFGQNIRAYQLRSHFNLGAGSLQATLGLSNDGVNFSGATAASPYDLTHNDRRGMVDLAWTRSFANSELTFATGLRAESLTGTGIDPLQKRTVHTFSIHGSTHPTSRLALDGGIYSTNDNTFGASLDGRAALAYDLAPGQLLRFSVGTGFRAPLLIEQYLFPASALPPPDVNGIIIGQGNPNERPEHATEYELGYARHFGAAATLDVSLYRTNLRDPIENYYPVPIPGMTQYSYPINVGNVVYQGAEIRYRK
ncbi:MAG: TonB-dependent receptor, partial [Vulcanimicrobiaceae bacterium]